jgi:hypothetical protein
MDFSAASRLGLKSIWALSLPGRVAPVTAGIIIRDTIYNILRGRASIYEQQENKTRLCSYRLHVHLESVIEELKKLAEIYDITPIMSPVASTADSRYGLASTFTRSG